MNDKTQTAIDLLPYLIPLATFVWAVVRAVGIYYVDKRVKNQQLRDDLERALQNGLGVLQQMDSGATMPLSGRAHIMLNVPGRLAPAVTYVLEHAPAAVKHLGLTPDLIAEQIIARVGRREIDANVALTASSATAAVVPPLAPSHPVTEAPEITRGEALAEAATPQTAAIIVPPAQ
jgi:hypothetical protein